MSTRTHPTSSAPATVLYTARAPFYSGAEHALVRLVDRLDRRRFRPIVAVSIDGELSERLRERGVETLHVPVVYTGARTIRPWLRTVARLLRLMRRSQVRLVHANDLQSHQTAAYAARMWRLPSVCHIRFPDTRRGYQWFLRPRFDRALFISRSLLESGMEAAPLVFGGRSEVVYDGVDVPALPTEAARHDLRQSLGFNDQEMVVVLAGQVAEVKGIWDLLEAATILRDHPCRISFAIVGEDLRTQGLVRREAEAIVRQRGLGARVRFFGFRRDVQTILPAFDIVAMPSHVEPLGLSALEGMAASRPIVGTHVGGIAETVVDKSTGLLVPPRTPARLAAAIADLATDRERAQRLGARGRQRVIEHFSIEAHVATVEAVYTRLLGPATGGGEG